MKKQNKDQKPSELANHLTKVFQQSASKAVAENLEKGHLVVGLEDGKWTEKRANKIESEDLRSLSDVEFEVKFSAMAAENNRRLGEKKLKALKEHEKYAQAIEGVLTTDFIDTVIPNHIKDREECIAEKYKHDAWDWSEDKIPACLRCCLLALLNGNIKLPFGQKLKISIEKNHNAG